MYQVGVGDSPMSIAGYLGGNRYRVGELLAANPHKSIAIVGGWPTFASLGVGERLIVPLGFVGDQLAEAFGVGTHEEAFAKLAQSFGTSDPEDAFAKLAHSFGVHDEPDIERHLLRDGWQPGGSRITGLSGMDTIGVNGMRCAFALGDIGLGSIFDSIGSAVSSAVSSVGKAAGQAAGAVANVASNAAKQTQNAFAGAAKFVAQAGGDAGKWLSTAAKDLAKNPLGTIANVATKGPLGLILNPDKLLNSIGIPGPSDILHTLGLPTPVDVLKKAGIPTDPAFIAEHIFEPGKLLENIPGVGEIAKYIPNAPNPVQMATNIVSAAASGDLNKLKTAVIDVGHQVASIAAMIPGVGNVIGAPLDSALTLLETGSPLKAALILLLNQIPLIPPDIRNVFLRPAIEGVADIIESKAAVTDALVTGIKDGIMREAAQRNIPEALRKVIGDFLDGAIQLIFQAKPLSQVAAGFAERGISNAIGAAAGQVQLPKQLTDNVDNLKRQFNTAKDAALKQFGDISKVPANVMTNVNNLEKQYKGALDTVLGKLPKNVAAQVNSAIAAQSDVLNVGQKLNEIHALTKAIIDLNKRDPTKKNPTIQKQISDVKATIKARRLGLQANAKSLDANLGKQPPATVAPAVLPAAAVAALAARVAAAAKAKAAAVPAAAPASAQPRAYHPYPAQRALPHLAQKVIPPRAAPPIA